MSETKTVGYDEAKKQQSVARYLRERDQQDRLRPPDQRLERSRAWLAKYLSPDHKRPTAFNWAPRYAFTRTPPGAPNGKEIIDGDYTVVADTHAPSEGSGSGGQQDQGDTTSFTSGDRTPF